MYIENSSVYLRFELMIPKGISQTSIPKPISQIYTLEKEITSSRGRLLWKYLSQRANGYVSLLHKFKILLSTLISSIFYFLFARIAFQKQYCLSAKEK
jgi:hypothetical protein